MFPWWPKTLPFDLIPVFRSLGRKAVYGDATTRDDLPACISNVTRPLTFGDDLSLKEQGLLRRCPSDVVYLLGRVLADGVKYFEIPSDFQALNEIEISLSVKDYVQPFRSVIVKAGEEYHLIAHGSSSLCIGAFDPGGNVDWANMFGAERSIESYLTDPLIVTSIPKTDYSAVVHAPDGMKHHRWRATLNFLLICTMEGVLSCETKVPSRLKRHHLARLAKPNVYRPQNIELLKRQYSSAIKPHEVGDIVGSMKRPHWRRAHWRRVAVGVGRTERQLRFIRASFIHKDLIRAVDDTTSTYKVGREKATV